MYLIQTERDYYSVMCVSLWDWVLWNIKWHTFSWKTFWWLFVESLLKYLENEKKKSANLKMDCQNFIAFVLLVAANRPQIKWLCTRAEFTSQRQFFRLSSFFFLQIFTVIESSDGSVVLYTRSRVVISLHFIHCNAEERAQPNSYGGWQINKEGYK